MKGWSCLGLVLGLTLWGHGALWTGGTQTVAVSAPTVVRNDWMTCPTCGGFEPRGTDEIEAIPCCACGGLGEIRAP